MIKEGELLWAPSEALARGSNLARYLDWLAAECNLAFPDYDALWNWSVREPDAFWSSIWRWHDVQYDGSAHRVTDGAPMPHTRWFPDARVNYAEHVLRHAAHADAKQPAFHHATETTPLQTMPLADLASQVRRFATRLRELGVRPGDRVVAYLPNVPECAVAMLAAIGIGAVWSSAAIDFGVRTVVDRFRQIEPTVLIAADGYRFGGKAFDRQHEALGIARALPSLRTLIWLPNLADGVPADASSLPCAVQAWDAMLSGPDVAPDAFRFERVGASHPLWIVFSSGTTGLPKAIVHSHAGMLVEHLKILHLHMDLRPGDVMFFYSTTGWMMWNMLVAALLTGASAVLYDGSPMHGGPECLWRLAADAGATCFGGSPTFVQMMEKAGLEPGRRFDLSALRSVLLSGAPSTPETFAWFYRNVKSDLWVTSQSGGTELCSGLVGGVPLLPVRAGEIQARVLGMAVDVWSDDGKPLVDEVGELVVTQPAPSMPIFFWNDAGDARYRESYFEHFPGTWRHGDFMRLTPHGGCYIYGRADSTLNRYGVRIGSAEIYRVVEEIDAVADSLVVCCEMPNGGFFMPLFLRLRDGAVLDDALRAHIAERLRTLCSPRHVPDTMVAMEQIPYTLTGKKMEVPVRKILMGRPAEQAASRDAMANPAALDAYVAFAGTMAR
ncbi:acetoacetyl-CoA synthetase [Burkholderia stagnalis]|uniref:acetoacetate--CoA ligase n=1 Tax=Burkholderia stagnalis TaxID=1503054 RepID=UPI00075E06F6|nr:acetoacetate--CoA ligase [Burkholderia stagnalis]AOK56076.1 acetoacetyl-CoA synthetase [Burkholderia stagnalis]KVN84171.1 acetoacetyl-CoA synthetase [Burkholderia stagnalis]KWO27755.1 acetoacetyl-CoA synthetase [Burkholderia stagnalis]KWO43842.1 acetoacetyl-CoA synthetase [Burkholderia stagnalis]